MDEIRVECFFGIVHLETRFRREGSTLVGEGRQIRIGDDGVTKAGPWKPTGCVVHNANQWPSAIGEGMKP